MFYFLFILLGAWVVICSVAVFFFIEKHYYPLDEMEKLVIALIISLLPGMYLFSVL